MKLFNESKEKLVKLIAEYPDAPIKIAVHNDLRETVNLLKTKQQ